MDSIFQPLLDSEKDSILNILDVVISKAYVFGWNDALDCAKEKLPVYWTTDDIEKLKRSEL